MKRTRETETRMRKMARGGRCATVARDKPAPLSPWSDSKRLLGGFG